MPQFASFLTFSLTLALFLHVRLRNIFEEIRSGQLNTARLKRSDLLVLRNSSLSSTYEDMDHTALELTRPLYKQLRKKYNWLFQVPHASDSDPDAKAAKSVFCTELCVLLLHHLDVTPVTWKAASSVLPVDFEDLLSHGWSDVTDEWIEEIESISRALSDPGSQHARLVLPREKSAELWIKETEGWMQITEKMEAIAAHTTAQMDSILAKAKKRLQ
jgi:hypothetical protein